MIAIAKAWIARLQRALSRKRLLNATQFPDQCPDPSIFTE